MYDSQLIQLVPLHYRHGFHSRLAELNRILRYFLGGERPTQTAHQTLSLVVFSAEVRKYIKQDGYFTDDSRLPGSALQSLTTILRMQNIFSISNCSKAPGVFSSNCR